MSDFKTMNYQSYIDKISSGQRFNLWVTKNDHSKVICWGPWQEMTELVNPIMALDSIRAVHVLPDGEEPSFTPASALTHYDEDDSWYDE